MSANQGVSAVQESGAQPVGRISSNELVAITAQTETRHTPGPWNIHESYTDSEPFLVKDRESGGPDFWTMSRYVAQGEKIIADVAMFSDHEGGGWPRVNNAAECIANAHLMSAAPELLAALRGIVNSLYAADEEGLMEHAPQMQAAHAAIAKAEGKA